MTQEQWKLVWVLVCDLQERSSAEREAILNSSALEEAVLEHAREIVQTGDGEPGDLAATQDEGTMRL